MQQRRSQSWVRQAVLRFLNKSELWSIRTAEGSSSSWEGKLPGGTGPLQHLQTTAPLSKIVGIGWAAGGLNGLDGTEPYLWSNYFVHLWLKNRRKGTKKQDGKIQLFDKHEGRVNGHTMTNQKNTKILHTKRPSPMRLWGWGTGDIKML